MHIVHFVTEKCNARCPHCFIGDNNKSEELTLSQIEYIIKSIPTQFLLASLTGGEPFLRSDFNEVLNLWLQSNASAISITTNGYYTDKIENILSHNIKKPVNFSFSCDFPSTKHDDYRKVKALHLKMLDSYKAVSTAGKKFSANVSITVSPFNYNYVLETHHWLKNCGVKNIGFLLTRNQGAFKIDTASIIPMGEAFKNLARKILSDEKTSCAKLSLQSWEKAKQAFWQETLSTFLYNKHNFNCAAGKLLGIIYPNGQVSSCEVLKPFASIKDYNYDFKKLWQSTSAREIRKKIETIKCRCTFECAQSINILSSIKCYPKLFKQVLKYHQ